VWAMAGGGLATYDPRTKQREDVSGELQRIQRKLDNPNTPMADRKSLKSEADSMLEAHLVNAVKYDTENKGLADQVKSYKPGTPISPELTEAVQKEKYDIAIRAVEKLSAEDKKDEKDSGDDKGIQTAREILRSIAPTSEEAIELFENAYKEKYGRLTELVGEKGHKHYVPKKSVRAARIRIRAMYGK